MVQLSEELQDDRKRHQCSNGCSSNTQIEISKFINLPGLIPIQVEPSIPRTITTQLWQFLKIQYKSILSYTLLTVLVTIILIKYDLNTYTVPKKWAELSWSNLINKNYELQKSDNNYLQAHSPDIYETLLKELRQIQQAATYLQSKQQIMEKKTVALTNQFKILAAKSRYEGIVTEARARDLIKEALDTYDADKLGLRDYALESAGGCVVSVPMTTPYLSETQYIIFGFISFRKASNPRLILEPDIQPGKCFAFEGSTGRIRIKLANTIFVSAITLEHSPLSLLTVEDIQSAPKEFELIGLLEENAETGINLGGFKYSIDGTSIQTFLVSYPDKPVPFQFVEVVIKNNYGNKYYTCVYRVRIHGRRL